MTAPSPALALVFSGLLLIAGCTGAPTETSPAGQESPDAVSYENSGIAFCCVSNYYWQPNLVRYGGGIPAQASLFYVVYENETMLGLSHVKTDGGGVGTGATIRLESQLRGNHTIRIEVYEDTDGDGEFDPATDRPVRNGDGLVRAGPQTFNFSAFAGGRSW